MSLALECTLLVKKKKKKKKKKEEEEKEEEEEGEKKHTEGFESRVKPETIRVVNCFAQ